MYFIYLVRCKDNSLYCGQTKDLEKRIKEHNCSNVRGARYTKWRRPVKLVYFEEVVTISDALKREYIIKKLSKQKKEFLVLSIKKTKNMISTKGQKNGAE